VSLIKSCRLLAGQSILTRFNRGSLSLFVLTWLVSISAHKRVLVAIISDFSLVVFAFDGLGVLMMLNWFRHKIVLFGRRGVHVSGTVVAGRGTSDKLSVVSIVVLLSAVVARRPSSLEVSFFTSLISGGTSAVTRAA